MNRYTLVFTTFLLPLAGSVRADKSSVRKLVGTEASESESELSVLVIRGGHAYDTPAFEEMCMDLQGMKCDLVLTAHFEQYSAKEIDDRYDTLLFLNQNKKYRTEDRNRKRYMDLAQLGTGMVFLHFTLSSEPDWDEYHDLVGGKWFLKKYEKNEALHSTYFTDMTVDVKVLDADHPTTAGLSPSFLFRSST